MKATSPLGSQSPFIVPDRKLSSSHTTASGGSTDGCVEGEVGTRSLCMNPSRGCSIDGEACHPLFIKPSTEFVSLLGQGHFSQPQTGCSWFLESVRFDFLCSRGCLLLCCTILSLGSSFPCGLEYRIPHSTFGSSDHDASTALQVDTGECQWEALACGDTGAVVPRAEYTFMMAALLKWHLVTATRVTGVECDFT